MAAKVQDEDGVLVFILGLFPNVMQKEIASWGKPTVMFNRRRRRFRRWPGCITSCR